MDMANMSIDDQIRKEIERIARDVIDWEQSQEVDGTFKPYWKPRFDREHFKGDKKRIVPLDLQTYYDLQLSRGQHEMKAPA